MSFHSNQVDKNLRENGSLRTSIVLEIVQLLLEAGVEVDVVRAEIQDKVDKQLAKNAREHAKWIANNPQYAHLA